MQLVVIFIVVVIALKLRDRRAKKQRIKSVYKYNSDKNTIDRDIVDTYKNVWPERYESLNTVTDICRGTWSEQQLILTLLHLNIPKNTIFHDLYVHRYNDVFSQIDLVVPTSVGIIVFEVKDYSGWLFGKGTQDYWTQVLSYGDEKHRFYNPIKQNAKHIEVLRDKLKNYADVPFYSVIVFYGNCVFKNISEIPDNVFLIYGYDVSLVVNKILRNNIAANYANKREVLYILREAVMNGAKYEVRKQHLEMAQNVDKQYKRVNDAN